MEAAEFERPRREWPVRWVKYCLFLFVAVAVVGVVMCAGFGEFLPNNSLRRPGAGGWPSLVKTWGG